ncbi:cathelicidin-related peptide Oh-Cath-like isoform X1 [Hyperolius riggenbachi]|uniref:cathelicidin-related peptide Oh-Cath-like isoform X1 n=1 Tax=Hyperolius riggenbachi TaxID=752182 RepID=UPI0035A2F312
MDMIVGLLLLLGHLFMASPAPTASSTLGVSGAISKFLREYNSVKAKDRLYRQYQSEEQKVESDGRVRVDFSIKETICSQSRQASYEICPFQADGALLRCTVYIQTPGNTQDISGHCHVKNNTRLLGRDLEAAAKTHNKLSAPIDKVHKQECLECILSLLPKF